MKAIAEQVNPPQVRAQPLSDGLKPRVGTLLLLGTAGFLWFHLINHLRIEWTVNPAYTYGWAVPFLCCYLFWRRLNHAAVERNPIAAEVRSSPESTGIPAGEVPIEHAPARISTLPAAVCLAVLYFLTRLVEEANPDWRLVSAALAVETIGITFLMILLVFSESDARWLLFPLAYILVAVPWPTTIEAPLIQGLTRSNAAIVVELLGWARAPAVQHGNLIEIATGVVGVEEACSGIRSLQATLMLSLLFGEVYGLASRRRFGLVFAGFGLAILLNIIRTFFLVWLASRKGVRVLEQWHDSAGVGILLACFFVLWWFAWRLRPKMSNASDLPPAKSTAWLAYPRAIALRRGVAFAACLLLIELWVQLWYRAHERNVASQTTWSVNWPRQNSSWHELPISSTTHRLLRYDAAVNSAWNDEGARWQGIFLQWKSGASAAQLARSHTPEVCLTAAGHKVIATSRLRWADVSGLRMPYCAYDIQAEDGPFYVFYSLWDDRGSPQPFATASMTYGNRFRAVLAGQRNGGQRSLELAVWGFRDPQAAEAAYLRALSELVRVDR